MSADGQLAPDDRLIYYWAARTFYRGVGTIVDAGALVGATTVVLAEGVKANERACSANRPIHVYDLFTDDRDGYSAQVLKGWYGDEADVEAVYDFEKHFRRNTAAYAGLLDVHKGDIIEIGYTDPRRIEILSIDVAKSAALMHGVARRFFPHLAERSIILHQDYVFSYQPWLLIAMEMMSELVEKVYEVPTQVTAVFAPRGPISAADVDRCLGTTPDNYYVLENARYIYQAIDKATTPSARLYATASLAYFYLVKGRAETARYVVRRMINDFGLTVPFVERTELKHLIQTELGMDYKALCG